MAARLRWRRRSYRGRSTVPFANARQSTHVVTPADEVSSAGVFCVYGFGNGV